MFQEKQPTSQCVEFARNVPQFLAGLHWRPYFLWMPLLSLAAVLGAIFLNDQQHIATLQNWSLLHAKNLQLKYCGETTPILTKARYTLDSAVHCGVTTWIHLDSTLLLSGGYDDPVFPWEVHQRDHTDEPEFRANYYWLVFLKRPKLPLNVFRPLARPQVCHL